MEVLNTAKDVVKDEIKVTKTEIESMAGYQIAAPRATDPLLEHDE